MRVETAIDSILEEICDSERKWIDRSDVIYSVKVYYIRDYIHSLSKMEACFEINFQTYNINEGSNVLDKFLSSIQMMTHLIDSKDKNTLNIFQATLCLKNIKNVTLTNVNTYKQIDLAHVDITGKSMSSGEQGTSENTSTMDFEEGVTERRNSKLKKGDQRFQRKVEGFGRFLGKNKQKHVVVQQSMVNLVRVQSKSPSFSPMDDGAVMVNNNDGHNYNARPNGYDDDEIEAIKTQQQDALNGTATVTATVTTTANATAAATTNGRNYLAAHPKIMRIGTNDMESEIDDDDDSISSKNEGEGPKTTDTGAPLSSENVHVISYNNNDRDPDSPDSVYDHESPRQTAGKTAGQRRKRTKGSTPRRKGTKGSTPKRKGTKGSVNLQLFDKKSGETDEH